jgi:hypothetical protein
LRGRCFVAGWFIVRRCWQKKDTGWLICKSSSQFGGGRAQIENIVAMVFTGHNLYRLLTALCVVLALLFAWQLSNRWDWGALFFLAIALWSALRCYRLMSSKVEVTEDRVRIVTPGGALREVEFRQFSAVYEEGRGLKSIMLLYHPRTEQGIISIDVEQNLVLPAVNQHEELLAALTAKVPS